MTKEQLAKLGITIEGESATDEEVEKLLTEKFNSLNGDVKKHKDLLSARNSEIAEYKRKEQEKLTEEEKTKLHYEEMEKEIASLKRKDSLNTKINDLMSLGYDKDLATKYANAELDGKSTIEFQKQFMEAKLEAQKKELLNNTPNPKLNNPDGSVKTKEDFDKLGYEGQVKLYNEHPEIYKQFAEQK